MEKKQIMEAEEIVSASESDLKEKSSDIEVKPLDIHKHQDKDKNKAKKRTRVKEIKELREENKKVFKMSDGTERAVFYSAPVHELNEDTQSYEEDKAVLCEETDGRHFACKKKQFTAKFSKEDCNDELFSIQKEQYRVVMYSRKNKTNKNKGVAPVLHQKHIDNTNHEVIVYENVESGADFEYSINSDGVKENIIVKERAEAYCYPFIIHCENVTPVLDVQTKYISFISNETNEEVFFIPAPFMTDANGVVSTSVSYEMRTFNGGDTYLTVSADRDWINAEDRAFPVTIDPQVKLSYTSATTTYSWQDGNMTSGVNAHTIGTAIDGNNKTVSRMYMTFKVPTLPRNPRIKKAELIFTQKNSTLQREESPAIGLYYVNTSISVGASTPTHNGKLIDYAKMKHGEFDLDNIIKYTFDITAIMDEAINDGLSIKNLVLISLDETASSSENITLYGSTFNADYAPQIVVTYESSYAFNTSYRTHTHKIGSLGKGNVDLQCGNLMLEFDDFVWSGNRLPVTIKHMYNSSLSGYDFSTISTIKLNTAYFGKMKFGRGCKLNILQSMVWVDMLPIAWTENELNNSSIEKGGYIFMDENSHETYFKQGAFVTEENATYYLYEDVDGSGAVYNPNTRIYTEGDTKYYFDTSGRLIRITTANDNNSMSINYTGDLITSVTDGVGREFLFFYNSNNQLSYIYAPDHTAVYYSYTDGLLTGINYSNMKRVSISYNMNKPSEIAIKDASLNSIYKIAYTFNGARLSSVAEYGSNNNIGVKSIYSYSIASNKTTVTTQEQADGDEPQNDIVTTYTFDNDGNIVSEYVYSTDTGNVASNSDGSRINPHAENSGVTSNIDNLLVDHDFNSKTNWSKVSGTASNFAVVLYENESRAKFGKHILCLRSQVADCVANGIHQTTMTLPTGSYTFSAYIRVFYTFEGDNNPGVYLRVVDSSGNVLGVSERLTQADSEYIRLIVPFELTTSRSVDVQVLLDGIGTIYVDAAQLEKNTYANSYNLIENGNFENGVSKWTISDNYIGYSTAAKFNMNRSVLIPGSLEIKRNIIQTVNVKTARSTRETFTLSGWAKGNGLPTHERKGLETPVFRLRALIRYNDDAYKQYDTEEYIADFSPSTEDWQFASIQFSKSKYRTVDYIVVFCEYGYNVGNAYFDNIQLVRNSMETGLKAEDFKTEITDEEVEETETTEELAETEETDLTFAEVKDIYGNTLTETTFKDGEYGTIYRSFVFNEDTDGNICDETGNNLVAEVDARGNTTRYTVNSDTSRNEEVTDRCGNKTAYTYDDLGRVTRVTSKKSNGTQIAYVSYSYDRLDNMTAITRGDGLKYVLAYNEFHNLESIGIKKGTAEYGNLITYAYKNGNGKLKQMTYANGDTMNATYNSIGQMVSEKWCDKDGHTVAYYKYAYDGAGNIVRSIDIWSDKEYNYEYEEGKLIRATEYDIECTAEGLVTVKTLVNTIRYIYDNEGKIIKKIVIPATTGVASQTVFYEYTDDSNQIVKQVIGERLVTSHSKTDSFGRKEFDELQSGTGFISRKFDYHTGTATQKHKENGCLKSAPTTQLVSEIKFSNGRTIFYEYDAEERITRVDDSVDGVTEYTYDALGQLLTETVNGVAVNTMTYDNYGNILTKNGISYTYDTVWKDLLTSYNGQSITYDAQGNPTSYLGHTLAWEKGRQLNSFDNVTFTYNANGIRTSKRVNGITHNYTLEGTKILREDYGSVTLVPLYDNEDSVCGIIRKGIPYYFQKNLQGDIIAILNENSQIVARYRYDAWGVPTIVSDTSGCNIASINPFRYRGYYYDDEIGLYYLQSRYYDPVVGRFINGDDVEIAILSNEVLSGNIYSYCFNNPINKIDEEGTLSWDGIQKTIKKYFGQIIDKFIKFLKSLIVIKNNKVKISTSLISTTIDTIIFAIGSVAAFLGKKLLFEIFKKIVFKNKKTTSKFLSFLIGLFVKINIVRTVLWAISLAIKTRFVFIENLIKEFGINVLTSECELLKYINRLYSLTSFSGIVAFFLDYIDGKVDDYFSIPLPVLK